MTTTLCSFRCYDSPRILSDAAEGGLVIDKERKINSWQNQKKYYILLKEFREESLQLELSIPLRLQTIHKGIVVELQFTASN